MSGKCCLTYLGPSRDLRTNRWRVTCPTCGSAFDPATTMFASQQSNCTGRKCGVPLDVNYNEQTVTVIQ